MIFYSNALVCFLAGHLKRLLRRLLWNFRLGGMNLPCLSTRHRAADSLKKGKAADEAARLKPCLLESRSRTYIKYRSFGEMFQAFFIDFLAFFAGLAGFSGAAALRGRPLPGTLRIASTTDLSYILVRPAFWCGLIPALRSLAITAFGSILSIAAISLMVSPFITFISEIICKFFNFCNIAKYTIHILSKNHKKINKFCYLAKISLDNNFAIWQNYNIGY